MKKSRRILTLCLSLAMSTTMVFAKPEFNYIEKKETKTISEGVFHDKVLQFTSDGVRGINIVRFNLQDATTDLVPIYNTDTVSKGMAVTKMVDGHGVVAGINGDFFNFKPAFPLGLTINKGEMIHSNGENGPSVLVDTNNKLTIQNLNISMNISVNGKTLPVGMVNKPNGYGSTGMYTRAWGAKSRGGKVNSQTEIAVQNGLVIARADQGGPLDIPQDGYVLNIKDGIYLPNVGESVQFNITGLDMNNIKFGIGAGSVILRDGQIVNEGIDIVGKHPRTALGYNKNTDEIFLVTVDGRSVYHGMDVKELAELLLSLGATDGVNLDGGGSTTLAIRDVNSGKAKVVNHIKSQRPVLNGLGVKSSSEQGQAVTMKVITEGEKLFKNTRKWINLELYDAKGNPVRADLSKAKISANLPIVVDRHSFMPTESGDMVLSVSYGDLNESVNLKVLDSPTVLLLKDDTIGLSKGASYKIPDVDGIDAVGNRALIRSHELSASVVGGVGQIKNGSFIRNDSKTNGAIVLSFANAKNRIIVTSSARKESVNSLGSLEGLSSFSTPKGAKSSIKIVKDKRNVVRLDYNYGNIKTTKVSSLVFNKPAKLPNDTTELSIFTKNHGDSQITANIILGGVKSEHIFEENLKLGGYTEWRAKLPGANGIELQSISISDGEGTNENKGYVLIKDVAAVINPDTSSMFTDQRTLFNDHLKTSSLTATDIAIVVGGKRADTNSIVKSLGSHNKILAVNTDIKTQNLVTGMTAVDGNTMFVNFKNTQGGLRATDKKQWNELLTKVKNSDQSNILISIAGGSKDELGIINSIERDLLKETFESMVQMGKRVFVITNLKEPTSTIFDEGVRYINLNPSEGESLYLNINRIGDNLIYAIKRV